MPTPANYETAVNTPSVSTGRPGWTNVTMTNVDVSGSLEGFKYKPGSNSLVVAFRTSSGGGNATLTALTAPSPRFKRLSDEAAVLAGTHLRLGGPHSSGGFAQDDGWTFMTVVDDLLDDRVWLGVVGLR